MTWADEMTASVTTALERVGPAVVGVGRGRWGASGLVVADGVVLTVGPLERGGEVPTVFADGREESARVLATDGGLAALAVSTGGVAAPPWAAGAAGPGTAVVAVANPGGRGTRVSVGVVSGPGRSPGGASALEHTAPLPRGSAGGPLLSADGALLGVNAIRRPGGLVLALAADASLRARVEALSRGESRAPRPTLGVALAHPREAGRLRRAVGLPERTGLLVREVAPSGPAERAGLAHGDLLVAAGGRSLERLRDLRKALAGWTPEAPLALTVVRGVEEREVAVSREVER
jgi:serine protease Do